MKQHLDLLGMKAEDIVTGFKGVITSVSFDLYGCIQVAVSPQTTKDEAVPNGHWFDTTRIKLKGKKPVIKAPDFMAGYGDDKVPANAEHIAAGFKGAADKPMPRA